METTVKLYNKILKLIKKHKDELAFDLSDLEYTAKNHIFGLELRDKYGLNINPKNVHSTNWLDFGDKKIGLFGTKHNRTISWSADGRQPEDEYLLKIGFPTGPFIFGEGGMFNKDYPAEFFQKFFLELKTFNPDYIDEANRCLYWKLENAKDIFNEYDSIIKKYHELNKEDIKKRKIEKMKKELNRLENGE